MVNFPHFFSPTLKIGKVSFFHAPLSDFNRHALVPNKSQVSCVVVNEILSSKSGHIGFISCLYVCVSIITSKSLGILYYVAFLCYIVFLV